MALGRIRASISRLSLSSGSRVALRFVDTDLLRQSRLAVCGLSPVSIRVLMPSACSSRIAWRLLCLTVSATANNASVRLRWHDSRTTVLPWVFQRKQLFFQRRGAQAQLLDQPVVAQVIELAVDLAAHTAPGQVPRSRSTARSC
jgi:hypothetical protein